MVFGHLTSNLLSLKDPYRVESLEDLGSQYETHLGDVGNVTSDAGSLMQQVSDTVGGH